MGFPPVDGYGGGALCSSAGFVFPCGAPRDEIAVTDMALMVTLALVRCGGSGVRRFC